MKLNDLQIAELDYAYHSAQLIYLKRKIKFLRRARELQQEEKEK